MKLNGTVTRGSNSGAPMTWIKSLHITLMERKMDIIDQYTNIYNTQICFCNYVHTFYFKISVIIIGPYDIHSLLNAFKSINWYLLVSVGVSVIKSHVHYKCNI